LCCCRFVPQYDGSARLWPVINFAFVVYLYIYWYTFRRRPVRYWIHHTSMCVKSVRRSIVKPTGKCDLFLLPFFFCFSFFVLYLWSLQCGISYNKRVRIYQQRSLFIRPWRMTWWCVEPTSCYYSTLLNLRVYIICRSDAILPFLFATL